MCVTFLHLYILETTFTNDYIDLYKLGLFLHFMLCILQFSIPIHVTAMIKNYKFNCILLDILNQMIIKCFDSSLLEFCGSNHCKVSFFVSEKNNTDRSLADTHMKQYS